MPISGRLRNSSMKFPIYMLVTIPQKISGFFFKIKGPGMTPCIIKAARRRAVTELKGRPNVSKGMKAPAVPELFAVSGPATPSIAPVPNFSGCLDIFFSKP